ncbi:MAG TPA: SUMF1/EgtB/PvdO family nonheme iron enzyme [Phycisphaerales bacterium]|mgnify:CR=1 FL=1|nr:SUMF1/EgtB/PvdO family nonheme iron enzyme [Phycisphaerales bacterium]
MLHGRGLAAVAIGAAAAGSAASRSLADIDPMSGLDFVRVSAVGNAPWMGTNPPMLPGQDRAIGRGQVNYEYHIGKFEVTTAQWTEFFNAAMDRPLNDRLPWISPPTFWGAAPMTATVPGGQRWTVPAGNEMRPVGNISWRMAAMYCNWLHNGKSTDRSAFMNGAYDVSQFGGTTDFTDQLTHNAGALYWIPTWDEWLKAAHYDPNRGGPGQGGWWEYSNRSNTQLVAGPPGAGQANFGWRDAANSQWTVLLGAYPDTTSPWGLLDVAGGTAEWTEGVLSFQGSRWRMYDGSSWGSTIGDGISDAIFAASGSDIPSIDFLNLGVRIASTVPTPPQSAFVLIGSLSLLARRRRRRYEAAGLSGGVGCRGSVH